MVQTKTLATISYAVDELSPVIELGDVGGFFDAEELAGYVSAYGGAKLMIHLSNLQDQVLDEMLLQKPLVQLNSNKH